MNCHICKNKLTEVRFYNSNFDIMSTDYSCDTCLNFNYNSFEGGTRCSLYKNNNNGVFYLCNFEIDYCNNNYAIFIRSEDNKMELAIEDVDRFCTILSINYEFHISIDDDLSIVVPKLLEKLLKLVVLK